MRVMVNGNSSPLVDVVSGAVSGAQFADVQWNSGVQTAAVFNSVCMEFHCFCLYLRYGTKVNPSACTSAAYNTRA